MPGPMDDLLAVAADAQDGCLARISLSWAMSRSESSWLRWKTLRPKIRPVAPVRLRHAGLLIRLREVHLDYVGAELGEYTWVVWP
jgi:hypothetical protein